MVARRPLGWVFFWLACGVLLFQSFSLVDRARGVESDFGVFYRTCQLLSLGTGGDLYDQWDAETGWPIAIPPAGTALFQPFSALDPLWSGVAWAAFNLGLCCLGLVALRRLVGDRVFPWAGSVFLVLAGSSVQVGQFSVLFAVCWLLALAWWDSKWGALAFVLPAAIKLYPALLLLAPVLWSRSGRERASWAGWALLSLAAVAVIVPFAFYGGRVYELTTSFFEHVVLDPSGRVKWMQALGSTENQSVDALMIRYLSVYPSFHGRFSWMPTLGLDLDLVRTLAHIVRFVFIGATLVVVWRWRSQAVILGQRERLGLMAVWASTLYVALPETRARYAVMAFIGLVPVLLWVAESPRRRAGWTVALVLLVAGVLPRPLDVLGVGAIGALALWATNLRLLVSQDGGEELA